MARYHTVQKSLLSRVCDWTENEKIDENEAKSSSFFVVYNRLGLGLCMLGKLLFMTQKRTKDNKRKRRT